MRILARKDVLPISGVAELLAASELSDGRVLELPGGAIFRWSVALGRAVRPWVFGSSPADIAQISGALDPTLEDPAWSWAPTGTPTKEVAGGKVVLTAGSGDQARLDFAHGINTGEHAVTGLFQLTSATGDRGDGRQIQLYQGGDGHALTFGNTAAAPTVAAVNSSGAPQHAVLVAVRSDTAERYVEAYARRGAGLEIYVDGSAQPVAQTPNALLTDTTQTTYRLIVGTGSAVAYGVLTIRNCHFFGYA